MYSVKFPLGKLILVTGVSGSGKSTLINETLYPLLSKYCYNSKAKPLDYKSIKGLEHIDKVIEIDQSPLAEHQGVTLQLTVVFLLISELYLLRYPKQKYGL